VGFGNGDSCKVARCDSQLGPLDSKLCSAGLNNKCLGTEPVLIKIADTDDKLKLPRVIHYPATHMKLSSVHVSCGLVFFLLMVTK
jgi:hypothetical protein